MLAAAGVDLWALDEVCFQQYGSRARMWIPPEEHDPVLQRYPGRKSLGYYGAVRVRDGRLLMRRECEPFTGETCWAFLRELYTTSRRARRLVAVIADNATYHYARLHQAWRAERVEKFRVEFLPPYSPELNPIERVWKLTRRLCVHNRYFPTLEAVSEAVEYQFAHWAVPNETLRKLCAIS